MLELHSMKAKPDCATVRVAGDQLTFGAGSVPCKERHTISTEIELAWPMTQVGAFPFGSPSRVRCSVFWSPFSPWQFFADEKSNLGLRGLNGSEGIGVSSAASALSAVQQFFKFF